MRDADVTHASNVRPWCDRTIHSKAEVYVEDWEKTSPEEISQSEITLTVSLKLFILKYFVKSWVTERKKDQTSGYAIDLFLPNLCFLEMLSGSQRTASLCFQQRRGKPCPLTAIPERHGVGHVSSPRKRRNTVCFQEVKKKLQYHLTCKLCNSFPYLLPPFGPNPARRYL